MALCWEDKKVALVIDDDPFARPFEEPDDWTVLHITSNDLYDYDAFNSCMKTLQVALGEADEGEDYPPDLFDLACGHMGTIQDEYAWALRRLFPYEPKGDDSELPPHSVVELGDGSKYFTPEYVFLETAASEPLPRVVQVGMELCGNYATDHTGKEDDYVNLGEPFCSVEGLRSYLRGAQNCSGYERAMDALEFVVEGVLSPMGTYLIECLCLPRELGGYDLVRPTAGGLFDGGFDGMGRAPLASGPYLAYDLCWPWCRVALQYVGNKPPTGRERRSLAAEPTFDMDVVCVTTQEVKDPKAFEEAVNLLASKLDVLLPNSNPQFVEARTRLRNQLRFPEFEHMALTHRNAHVREVI